MYKIYRPKSLILQKYIGEIFILNKFDGSKGYFAFPFFGNLVGLFNQASIKFNDSVLLIEQDLKSKPKAVVLGNYKHPIYLFYNGYVPEISINFRETGLNYFFKKNVSDITPNIFQFIKSDNWINLIVQLSNINDDNIKFELIESFLLKNFIPKKISKINASISIIKENPNCKVSDIASKLNVSSRTINRLFKTYTGISPTDAKKIIQFRNVIHSKHIDPSQKLIEVCYDNEFYDYSYFNREFKKITSSSPKTFFKNIDMEMLKEFNIPFQFQDF